MSIQQDYEKFGIVEDRLPGDFLELPAKWEQIKIKPNDLIISDTINHCVDKLYENVLYIFSKSIIPTNDIPVVKYAQNMIIDTGHTQATRRLIEGEFETNDGELSQPVTIKSTIDGPSKTTITGAVTAIRNELGIIEDVRAMTINETIDALNLPLTVSFGDGDQTLKHSAQNIYESGSFALEDENTVSTQIKITSIESNLRPYTLYGTTTAVEDENGEVVSSRGLTINEIIDHYDYPLYVNSGDGEQVLKHAPTPEVINFIPGYSESITIEGGEFVTIEISRNTAWSSSTPNDNDLQGIKHIVKTTNGYNPNNYNIFACTSTNVIIISGAGVDSLPDQRDSINILQNSDVRGAPIVSNLSITHPSNGLHFRDIRGIALTDAKDFFVLDGFYKQLFKFDVSGAIYLDPAILKNDTPGRLLTLMMGGDGDLDNKTNFLNPVKLLTIQNLLYVLDYDTQTKQAVIKVFDSSLNWRQSFNIGKLHTKSYIDFNYNPDTNRFYFLVHDQGETPEMITYSFDFDLLSTEPLMDLDKHSVDLLTENYIKFVFSIENPNIYYILTEHNVLKKYITKPLSFLGQFKLDEREIGPGNDLELNPTRSLVEMFIHPVSITDGVTTIKKDEILIYESTYPGIYQFLEDSGFKQSFESTTEDKLLPIQDLYIKHDEPVDMITYNKLIHKLLYNNISLLQNISRKFSTQFDSKGFARYVGFKYLNVYELSELYYETSTDNYISGNEIILAETVNRCLKKIYDIQVRTLNVMQERSLNVFPLTDRPVILT